MIDKKVELLAPAGNYACFLAAMNAGADAVYIGGSQYGARAYADNFSEEEIIEAIQVAHIFQRKLYMTVNTLVKNQELDNLVSFMTPYYEAGLDGVIIQDMGVFTVLKENFPGLELHASTQMTLTGKYGAAFLKEIGASRIVPAREVSLEEIRDIKENVDIEIEAFIHGAMCYGYSGQCLFSSILGGRSGNRGRCAGPCRLPYAVPGLNNKQNKESGQGKDIYPLSLKDMYTLPLIPKLIEAGIDSFKIEGRMKSPAYVAGVTSVYRKYIDQYLAHPEQKFEISKEDEAIVTGLYVRSGLQEGYYNKHNGKDMITLQGPGYAGTNEAILAKIQEKYLQTKPQLPIFVKAILIKGQPSKLIISNTKDGIVKLEQQKSAFDQDSTSGILVLGEEVQQAQKRPLTNEDIEKQLRKMGDTYFTIKSLSIESEEDIFMPVKAINELRRQAVETYQALLVKPSTRQFAAIENVNLQYKNTTKAPESFGLSVLITQQDQIEVCLQNNAITRLYLDIDLVTDHAVLLKKLSECDKELYLALPYIFRKRSYCYQEAYKKLLEMNHPIQEGTLFSGVLIRTVEELSWISQIAYKGNYIADANIYTWNEKSKAFYEQYFSELTVPTELNRKERKHLTINGMETVVYGRIPMMLSANCTRKTVSKCTAQSGYDSIVDRYKNEFPIYHNCKHCYNVIYNTVPLSLHQYIDEMKQEGVRSIRLEFTNESKQDIKKILAFYTNKYQLLMRESAKNMTEKNIAESIFEQGSYTTGHYKRGVE